MGKHSIMAHLYHDQLLSVACINSTIMIALQRSEVGIVLLLIHTQFLHTLMYVSMLVYVCVC